MKGSSMKNKEDLYPLKSNNLHIVKELFAFALANPELSFWQLMKKFMGDKEIKIDGYDTIRFVDKMK